MSVPVFPNWYPFNDMLLDGHLRVGDYHVKTRGWDWKYRGWVLLYTSGGTSKPCAKAYGYRSTVAAHQVIIGAARLADVRLLTEREELQVTCNFNNLSKQLLRKTPLAAEVFPLRYGFFFYDMVRFPEPVPFKWPAGPVKPIFTDVKRKSPLEHQLIASGVQIYGPI